MKKFVITAGIAWRSDSVFVSLIIYSIERSLPTSYVKGKAMAMSQKQGAKPYEELLADLNASYGLDKPVLEGYFVWLKDAVRGDFGESWVWTQPVTQKFANVIWYSFALSAVAFVWNHDSDSAGNYFRDKAVQQGGLCGDGIRADRYITANVFLCDDPEMDFLHQSWMVRPVWYRRAYA